MITKAGTSVTSQSPARQSRPSRQSVKPTNRRDTNKTLDERSTRSSHHERIKTRARNPLALLSQTQTSTVETAAQTGHFHNNRSNFNRDTRRRKDYEPNELAASLSLPDIA